MDLRGPQSEASELNMRGHAMRQDFPPRFRSLSISLCLLLGLNMAIAFAQQPSFTLNGAIQTSAGNFFTAVNGGGQGGAGGEALSTLSTVAGPNETFQLVWQNRQQCKFALTTRDGHFVTAMNGGGVGGTNSGLSPMHTDATSVRQWENFGLLIQPDGISTFIRTADGQHFVTAAGGGSVNGTGMPFGTTATSVGAFEQFSLSPLNNCTAFTAAVSSVVSNPVYVNLYWDATWDVDNPQLPLNAIDSLTAGVSQSSYFGGLSEYGISSPSYGGGFIPTANCPQRSPNSPGFYDPFNSSIVGFLNCELQHGNVPIGNNVIYNIILPSYALESDLFGGRTLCQGGNPVSWHFHGTPYDPAVSGAIAASLLNGVPTVETVLGLIGAALSSSGPVWTIVETSPACGTFSTNLFHEMVEAATDPFPSLGVIPSGSGEVADECAGLQSSSPFVPSLSAGGVVQVLNGGNSVGPLTVQSNLSVPGYWSNFNQKCIPGFVDQTAPGNNSFSVTINSGQGPTMSMNITGKGLGALPAQSLNKSRTTLPYLAIQDVSQNWQAGNSLNSDLLGLNIVAWSDTAITINGIGGVGSNFTMKSSDALSAWACNPASGQCVGTSNVAISAGAFSPNLVVVLSSPYSPTNIPAVQVKVDGASWGSIYGDSSSTGWRPIGIGRHSVSADVLGPSGATYVISYIAGCDANGGITLSDGQNATCVVGATPKTEPGRTCPSGEVCCSPGTKKCIQCVTEGQTCPKPE